MINGNSTGIQCPGKDFQTSSSHVNHESMNSHFATLAVHAGSPIDTVTGAVIAPISLSTTFSQIAAGQPTGKYEYSRSSNPNRENFETAMASLEKAKFALAFSSGSAALAAVLMAISTDLSAQRINHTTASNSSVSKVNVHAVSVADVYGGTYRYFTRVAPTHGVHTSFTYNIGEELEGLLTADTRLVWIETPSNPTLKMVDIEAIVQIVRQHYSTEKDFTKAVPMESRPLVVVDNTFMSPYIQNPLTWGADIVIHSVTKYINGHSDVVMGVLAMNDSILYERLTFLQNALGAVPSAFDCWLAHRGLKTLHLRMKASSDNALKIAQVLVRHPHVVGVNYPGLYVYPNESGVQKDKSGMNGRDKVEDSRVNRRVSGWGGEMGSDSSSLSLSSCVSGGDSLSTNEVQSAIILKQHRQGLCGGMLSFRIRGGSDVAQKFCQSTKLFTLAESLGGIESLCEIPAIMTHASISPEHRAAAGVTEDLIRLSVGVEEGDDLLKDILHALDVAVGCGLE